MSFRRRDTPCEPQVANAKRGFVDLTPVSQAPAAQVRSAWAAVLPDTDPAPLIWERGHDDGSEEDPGCV